MKGHKEIELEVIVGKIALTKSFVCGSIKIPNNYESEFKFKSFSKAFM